MIVKAKLKKDLDAEVERNKDDVKHLEMMEKHYKKRELAYEVRAVSSTAACE